MSSVIFFSELNVAYNNCNWNVKVWTQTAASNHEGRGEFISDNNFPMLELGGTIFGKNFFVCNLSGEEVMFPNYYLLLQTGPKYMEQSWTQNQCNTLVQE